MDYDLNIMRECQSLTQVTAGPRRLAEVLEEATPAVLVHGDTTITFAASLAAFINRSPSVMWKGPAQLRSYNPYPRR